MTQPLIWTENRETNEWTAGEFRIIWTWTNATKLYRGNELLKTVRPGNPRTLMEYAATLSE
jgi:hypothetical protein